MRRLMLSLAALALIVAACGTDSGGGNSYGGQRVGNPIAASGASAHS